MSARSEEFARRRAELQLQCAMQRDQFAQSTAALGESLHVVDRGLTVIRSTRVVPMILATIGAVGFATRAGGLIRLVSRALILVNTVKQLKRAFR